MLTYCMLRVWQMSSRDRYERIRQMLSEGFGRLCGAVKYAITDFVDSIPWGHISLISSVWKRS